MVPGFLYAHFYALLFFTLLERIKTYLGPFLYFEVVVFQQFFQQLI